MAAFLWDEDRLDELRASFFGLGGAYGEKIFDSAVFGVLCVNGRHAAYLVGLSELGPVGLGEVGHLVNRAYMLLVNPFGYLTARECRHAQFLGHAFQLIECQT